MVTPTIVTGEERRLQLRAFGLSAALVAALDAPQADPIASKLWAANGDVLAELLVHESIRSRLPEGRIVPLCHVDASSIHYVLLVFREGDEHGTLLEWADELCEPIRGGITGFLTDALVQAWENEEVSEEALVAWAEAMGYPAAGASLAARIAR